MFENRFIRELLEGMYALAVMIAIGKWAIYVTYLERGYKAIGGEYCLIIIAYLVAWNVIHYFFDALEDLYHEQKRKKRGS